MKVATRSPFPSPQNTRVPQSAIALSSSGTGSTRLSYPTLMEQSLSNAASLQKDHSELILINMLEDSAYTFIHSIECFQFYPIRLMIDKVPICNDYFSRCALCFRSDVLGQVLPIISSTWIWSQVGIANLYTLINQNGYKFIYLSARAIGQAKITRDYLRSVKQGEYLLPDGPLLLCPSSLRNAFQK